MNDEGGWTISCNAWHEDLLVRGTRVVIPEIADDEVRRELLRANKLAGVRRLDALKLALSCVAITTETMLLAAELWAVARQEGRPAADEKALDGDVILAAQTRLLAVPRNEN
ncbi:MAG: hypothetical protein QOF33_4277, partial [Thermomicrobiales bacterium]|nr:hypothetical protein [Thermomicrobiales bacterium]